MNIIVQKFGGTSVSTEERRKQVIKKIGKAIENGFKPVVVVSAMGRMGEPYATDTLLSLVDSNFKNNNKNNNMEDDMKAIVYNGKFSSFM